MYWKVENEESRSQLAKEIEYSWKQLGEYRDSRTKLMDQYVGSRYGSKQSKYKKRLANLVYQMVTTYQFKLAANRPRFRTSAVNPAWAPTARRLQVNLNNVVRQIALEQTMQNTVLNALFGLGITKVGRENSVQVETDDDVYTRPGFPSAISISLDNYVHDMRASSTRTLRFAGDYYCVPRDKLKDIPGADKKIAEKIKKHADERHESTEDRAEQLGRSYEGEGESEDYVWLVDLWVPCEKKLFTLDAELLFAPLTDRDYSDYPAGPYPYLSFADVADNTMPIPPVQTVADMDLLYNSIMRKLEHQARRQKTVTLFNSADDAEADRIRGAEDGSFEGIKGDTSSVKEMKSGGVDQASYAFSIHIQKLFDRLAGNLEVLAGFGPQSGTVGQDQMISSAAGQLMSQMQYRVLRHAAEVGENLGYQIYTDPEGFAAHEAQTELGFPDVVVSMDFGPDHVPLGNDQKPVTFHDFGAMFEVEPYSMVYQSPMEQAAWLEQFVMTIALPLSQTPQAQQQGLNVDMPEFFRTIGELRNQPNLQRIIKFGAAPIDGQPAASQGPTKPAATSRTYERRSSTRGDNGKETDQIAQMMAHANTGEN